MLLIKDDDSLWMSIDILFLSDKFQNVCMQF